MKISELSLAQMARTGCTHRFEITYADLSATADTTLTLTLSDLLAKGVKVENVGFKVVTLFDGGATADLTLQIGFNVTAGTDVANGLLGEHSIYADAAYHLAGPRRDEARRALTAVTDTYGPSGPSVFRETGTITALFTSTSANLDALTVGEVHIFARIALLA